MTTTNMHMRIPSPRGFDTNNPGVEEFRKAADLEQPKVLETGKVSDDTKLTSTFRNTESNGARGRNIVVPLPNITKSENELNNEYFNRILEAHRANIPTTDDHEW